jgi:purine-nucleoside phosphorylase
VDSNRREAARQRIARIAAHPACSAGLARACRAARTLAEDLEPDAWPEVAVVLGSGLAGFENRLPAPLRVPFRDLGLPEPTVAGHEGVLVMGRLEGRRVAVLSGRIHLYEGHDPDTVCAAVRAMALLGTPWLLLSNAAGGLNPSFQVGDLMGIQDHVNLMGQNPLRGPHIEDLGPRFPDMTRAYDPEGLEAFRRAAKALGLVIREGVYLGVLGPSYETPAEIRAFRALGADAVGMSTVPEVIAAHHAGMRVAGISVITNLAAGIGSSPLSHEEVKAVGVDAGRRLGDLFQRSLAFLPRSPSPDALQDGGR